jgi:pimeloyl-ACP methyl ester carboxylesterase
MTRPIRHRKAYAAPLASLRARLPQWMALVLALMAGCARTADIPGGVAALERVDLGGLPQWIQIRGRNTGEPVLLWLHGGPGAAQMPIAHRYDGAIEDDFIVVHWDQRGAGKSNPFDFDERTLGFERFIADAHELTQYLRGRFGGRRIFLLGHSWGAQLGLAVASRYPEDYYAYIGVGQVVDRRQAQVVAHTWLERRIEASGNERDLRTLAGFGPPPFADHADYVAFARLVDRYGGNMDVSYGQLLWTALRAPAYTLLDYARWLRGARRGSGPMWHEPAYADFDAFTVAPRLELPACFVNGRNDYNTPAEVAEAYYRALDAPRGKRLDIVERGAHLPFLGDPAAFAEILREFKRQVLEPNTAGGFASHQP